MVLFDTKFCIVLSAFVLFSLKKKELIQYLDISGELALNNSNGGREREDEVGGGGGGLAVYKRYSDFGPFVRSCPMFF